MNRRALLRSLALALAAAVFVGVGVRLWFLDGTFRRVTIDGPSMAPAYCGTHYELKCGDCGFSFRCDAEHSPSDDKASCPNCGYTENSLTQAKLEPPDRVLIDRWPLLFRAPRRSEVVALRAPDSAQDFAVKRIAFLPGEHPAIRGGDLYDGDRLIQLPPFNHRQKYLDPYGLERDWQADRKLGPDEYFLLGDNQPVSIDSRHWGAIPRSQILGVVRKR